MSRPFETAPFTRPLAGEISLIWPRSFGVDCESQRALAPKVSHIGPAVPPVAEPTARLARIFRLEGLRFCSVCWLGVTIHSAESAAVNACGIGQLLTTTLTLLGSIEASFCQVRTPATQTSFDPMPSVLAPLTVPLTSTVVPRGMVMLVPTLAAVEVLRRTTVAVVFVERSTQMRL